MVWYVVAAAFFLWLCILSYLVWKTRKHYFSLTQRTRKQKLDEVLETLITDDQRLKQKAQELEKQIQQTIQDSRVYFQKIGLVRFNAFGRTGVDQSFVLALLDKEQSGIVVNFIYTHDGVRIYTKRVKKGEGEEFQLSDEEKKAIKESK